MNGDGYIKLYRQIWENHYLWDDKPFTRGQAWIDLLMLMNHKDAFVIKYRMTVHRGQRIISIRQLSERWGWSRTKTSDFLNSLQSAGMAKFESDTKKTVITIANYDFFQDVKATEKPPKSHRSATEVPATNKNEKNDKEKRIPLPLENVFQGRDFPEPVKAAITDWLRYKAEKKQDYKPTGLKSLLTEIANNIARYGDDAVVHAIIITMAQNWQGIVWDKAKNYTPPESPEPKLEFVQDGVDDAGNPTGKWVNK